MRNININLAPSKWIWAPSGRTLPNTFARFKKTFTIGENLKSAKGYILACSRYLLRVNGKRLQSGPAPSDPRYEEADTVDITGFLQTGENELNFLVCYFGYSEGTWISGRAGLIYKIELTYADGRTELLISDKDTIAGFDRSRPAGQYKRWFLRALQEEYDARKENDIVYTAAAELSGSPDKPSSLNGGQDYLGDTIPTNPEEACIRARRIPICREEFMPGSVYHAGKVFWNRDPDDWFRFRTPDAFTIYEGLELKYCDDNSFEFDMPQQENSAAYVTLRLPEQAVGYIDFSITAPEGTIIEAIVQESHDKNKTLWLDSYFYTWARFICKQGINHFVSFETESFLYLQLHVRNAKGKIKISQPGVLRKTYPHEKEIGIETDNVKLQAVFNAGINTLKNSAIETFSDGMGRERQQYGGDGTHQVMAYSYLYGAADPIVERYFETFGDGLTSDGYYIDCWPAGDRMVRISQAQLGMTVWAPILDHAFQFILEAYRYCKHCGNNYILQKSYKDFLKFYDFMLSVRDDTGLLAVENLVKVSVWIDHLTFKKQRDKRCVFNLYFAGMLKEALAPICETFGDTQIANEMRKVADQIVNLVKKRYYDCGKQIFIDNLPYVSSDGYEAVSDRTLATALLFGFCDNTSPSVTMLKNYSDDLRKTYPANMVWIYRALAKYGEADIITSDFENRWHSMMSVTKNNTLQEEFVAVSDANMEMCHCPLAPILAPYEFYLRIECDSPGFKIFSIAPNFGKINKMSFTVKTVSGEIDVLKDGKNLTLTFPKSMSGFIRQPSGEKQRIQSATALKIK